jgi:hypothetical protein
MADLSITAANVILSANGAKAEGIAGEAITAGKALYRDAADGKKLKLADANATGKTNVVGIALNDAGVGQPVHFCIEDPELAIGGTVALGAVLILSATAGGIAPVADAASGMEVVVIGVGVGSNKVSVNFRDPLPLRAGAVIAP